MCMNTLALFVSVSSAMNYNSAVRHVRPRCIHAMRELLGLGDGCVAFRLLARALYFRKVLKNLQSSTRLDVIGVNFAVAALVGGD